MCIYWNKLLIAAKVMKAATVLLLDKEGLEGSEIEKASLSAVQWKYSRHAVFNSGLQVQVA